MTSLSFLWFSGMNESGIQWTVFFICQAGLEMRMDVWGRRGWLWGRGLPLSVPLHCPLRLKAVFLPHWGARGPPGEPAPPYGWAPFPEFPSNTSVQAPGCAFISNKFAGAEATLGPRTENHCPGVEGAWAVRCQWQAQCVSFWYPARARVMFTPWHFLCHH